MTLEAWALFCAMETVLCLNPGPSALVVISLGMRRGTGAGVRATGGVLVANAIYFGLSAMGLVALHSISAEAFLTIKWAGAAYLIILGTRIVLRSLRSSPADSEPLDDVKAPGRAFWRGFVAQGANPNLLVYFSAVLPQFVDPTAALAPQVAILAVSSFAIEFTVLSGFAVLSHKAGRKAAPSFRGWLERAGGALLIGAGAGLASLDRE